MGESTAVGVRSTENRGQNVRGDALMSWLLLLSLMVEDMCLATAVRQPETRNANVFSR